MTNLSNGDNQHIGQAKNQSEQQQIFNYES